MPADKTQVFHDQIQVKQKELQPWTAQINTKQAEIDVATSERDALAKKAQALQAANKEARETLEALQEDLQTKVIWTSVDWMPRVVYILLEGFKTRRAQGWETEYSEWYSRCAKEGQSEILFYFIASCSS